MITFQKRKSFVTSFNKTEKIIMNRASIHKRKYGVGGLRGKKKVLSQ